MRYLVNGEEMRQLDHYSIETVGIPSMVLMERAALCVVEELEKRKAEGQKVLVLCGSGNNGADGLAIARMLTIKGKDVQLYVIGNKEHATEEWKTQYHICENMKIPLREKTEDFSFIQEEKYDVIVDAMLGTGLGRMVGGSYQDCMDAVNNSDSYVAAVDIPSGISSDTGVIMGTAVRADLTVTFEFEKLGLALFPGKEYAGECVVRSIGIVHDGLEAVRPGCFTMSPWELERLPSRPAWSNKGTFGRVLIVAGSRNMAGAALLAGEAAYRTGAGLVRIFTPECNRQIIQTALPEAILTTYEDEIFNLEQMQDMCDWATSIVIGPGLGISAETSRFVNYILQYAEAPTVIDADALNVMAMQPDILHSLRPNCILTPHLGEMSRLIGVPIPNLKMNLPKYAREFSEKYQAILVQKDARTIVSSADGKSCYVNTCGNSGMSTGGSGDVLAGIIGGLLACGIKPYHAAIFGVLMHAHAGDLAAERYGERAMLARNIIEHL